MQFKVHAGVVAGVCSGGQKDVFALGLNPGDLFARFQ